jgi:hypothetical protein
MELGTMLRKVGNSLGGEFKSPEEKREEEIRKLEEKRKEKIRKLEEKIRDTKITLNNVELYAEQDSAPGGGDRALINRYKSEIFNLEAELAGLENNN